jgi:hypothetical protein
MNIRTRSDNTGPRPAISRFGTIRFLSLIALLAVALGACSTGNSESADEAATREAAQSTNVVGAVEQTQIVQKFFAPTPKPSPYPTQLPALATLRITTNPSSNGSGQGLYRYDRSSGTLYAQAQIARLHPGQTVVAVWTRGNDTVSVSEVGIGSDHDLTWISLEWSDSTSASSGEYAVHIQVRGPGTNDDGTPADVTTELGSLVFTVT